MKRLAIDTSTPRHSVALAVDGVVVSERASVRRGGQTRLLSRSIHELLLEADVRLVDLDEVVCGVGPGSFTGLRVGLAFLKGALSSTSIALRAVSTLDAYLALFPKGTTVAVALDARKQQVFATIAKAAAPQERPFLPASALRPEELMAAARALNTKHPIALAGNAATVFPNLVEDASPFVQAYGIAHPEARWLLAAAACGYGEIRPPALVEPLYIRPSDAELNGPRVEQYRA